MPDLVACFLQNQAVFHVEGMQGLNQGVGGYYGMQQAGSRSNSAGVSSTATGSGAASAGVGIPPNARNVPGHLPGYSGLWDPSRPQQQGGGGEDPVHLSPPQALNLLVRPMASRAHTPWPCSIHTVEGHIKT